MKRAALFFWLALPMAGYAIYALYGLPHMIWSYRFHDNGDPHNPSVARYYTDCTFIGPYGGFTVPADAGHCGWFRFFKPTQTQ